MLKKILIIEDDTILADTLQTMLQATGAFDITTANDANTGAELVESFQPDLILLDLLMPEVNGLDLLKRWHDSGLTDRIPVTISTNLDQFQIVNEALKLGAKSYFLKSEMSSEEIVDHCEKLLAGQTPETAPVDNPPSV